MKTIPIFSGCDPGSELTNKTMPTIRNAKPTGIEILQRFLID